MVSGLAPPTRRLPQMVTTTFQTIIVLLLALLPGALYVWGFESTVGGRWGIKLGDRMARFFGYSAAIQALILPGTYWFYGNYVRTGLVATGEPLPVAVWPVAVAYVVLPFAAGRAIGSGVRGGQGWAIALAGKAHAPRAWDHLFSGQPVAWVRIRLKSGSWIGGAFALDRRGRQSYASGYPHDQDLYLAEQAAVDPATGDLELDGTGDVRLLGRGVLIRWEEIEYLTFTDADQ